MPVTVPKYNELLMPTLLAVQSLAGFGSISEIVAPVIRIEGLSEDQQAVLHNEGPDTRSATASRGRAAT
jgi:restriction system protein